MPGWRVCDDSHVSREKNIVTKGAYLLFYRRREKFLPPPSSGLPLELSEEEALESALSDNDLVNENDDVFGNDDVLNNGQDLESDRKLVIDTSPYEQLPDLEDSNQGQITVSDDTGSVSEKLEIPEDDNLEDLGYSDMDAVD